MTKAKVVIEALNDYIGFLFSYTKELEKKLDELEEIVCDLDEKTPDDLYQECLAYKELGKSKTLNIIGKS